jgi:hypothetical protein
LRELRDLMTESNPRMTRLLPHRPRRRREVWVGEGSGCNHDIPGPCVGFGVQDRAAFRAEVQSHLATFLSVSDVEFTWTGHLELPCTEDSTHDERRSCAPLTFCTVAQMNTNRFTGKFCTQGTTATMRHSEHRLLQLLGGSSLFFGGQVVDIAYFSFLAPLNCSHVSWHFMLV